MFFDADNRIIGLTDEEIETNKQFILNMIDSFKEHDDPSTGYVLDKDRIKNYLLKSDFFDAPASTTYHSNFKGGLCFHTLQVYETLSKYIKMIYPDKLVEEDGHQMIKQTSPYSTETLQLVSIFHDISKVNNYKIDYRNIKRYSDSGKKFDEHGKFDWETVSCYKTKMDTDKFIFGTHGETSLYMAQKLVPTITLEESLAILHHMGKTTDSNMSDRDITPSIYHKYLLPFLLHQADEYCAIYLEGCHRDD